MVLLYALLSAFNDLVALILSAVPAQVVLPNGGDLTISPHLRLSSHVPPLCLPVSIHSFPSREDLTGLAKPPCV